MIGKLTFFNALLSITSYTLFIVSTYGRPEYLIAYDLLVIFFLFLEILMNLYVFGLSKLGSILLLVDCLAVVQIVFIFQPNKHPIFEICYKSFIGKPDQSCASSSSCTCWKCS